MNEADDADAERSPIVRRRGLGLERSGCEKRKKQSGDQKRAVAHKHSNRGEKSACPTGHCINSKHHAKYSGPRGLNHPKPARSAGIRPSAFVTCYPCRRRAIVQSAYDPLPPTASLEARGPGPARRLCPGCDSFRRRPTHESKTPNHFSDWRPVATAVCAGQRRVRRTCISNASGPDTRHGRNPQPHAQDNQWRAAAVSLHRARGR
jgi:hypothetical protein